MKKTILILLAVLMVLMFSSCEENIQPIPEVEVEPASEVLLNIGPAKSLSSDHDVTYDFFIIETEYLSDFKGDTPLVGELTNFKILKGPQGTRENASLGYFTQGKWLFKAKACNSEGVVLYSGQTEAYVSASSNNKIDVALSPYTVANGTLSIDILSILNNAPRLVVEYENVALGGGLSTLLDTDTQARGLVIKDEGNGYYSYKTTVPLALSSGSYKLAIRLYNGNDLFAGEVLDSYIYPDKNTNITGVFGITGSGTFLRLAPEESMTFTEAAAKIDIQTGTVVTGFFVLGQTEDASFPITNRTTDSMFILPRIAASSEYFSYSSTGVISAASGKSAAVKALKNVAFDHGYPSSPTSIGDSLFSGSTLIGIYAPDIREVGNSSFANSTAMLDCVWGTLSKVGSSAFEGCSAMVDSPEFAAAASIGTKAFKGSGIHTAFIPEGASLGNEIFANSDVTKASVPVDTIPDNLFNGCDQLVDLVLTNTVTIKTQAFKGCTALRSIILPETVQGIEASVFENCSSLDNTLRISSSINTIGANAFKNCSNLDEIYIDRTCGDIAGEAWGKSSSTILTYKAYKIFFDGNLGTPDGPTDEVIFPRITARNGVAITPMVDPMYRLIAYQSPVGSTLDGYAIPIPERSGYGFAGWYLNPQGTGTQVNQLTINTNRNNWTVYARWQKGLVTVVFNPGRGGSSDSGTMVQDSNGLTEYYRMVRYLENYGRIAAIEVEDDQNPYPLPSATVAGRNFLGWYFQVEPMLSGGIYPNETAQPACTKVLNSTQVTNREGHVLYAHYLDHRYTVKFNTNFPNDAANLKRGGTLINQANYQNTIPTRAVLYNDRFGDIWDPAKKSSPSYHGTATALPDLNASNYLLDYYYFKYWSWSPTTKSLVTENTLVPAQSANGATINVYAHWTGRDEIVTWMSYEKDPEAASYTPRTVDTWAVRYKSIYGKKVDASDVKNDLLDIPTALPVPTRTGYTFSGWYSGWTSGQVSGSAVTGGIVVNNPEDHTVYAKWTPKTYTLHFNSMGGSTCSDVTVTYHSKYPTLPTPTKAGYIFTGWYLSNIREEGYGYTVAEINNADYVRTANDHVLYAGWAAYEIRTDTTVTDTNRTTSFDDTHSSISYQSRLDLIQFSQTPYAEDGQYKSKAGTVNAPMTFAFKAVVTPTRKGKYASGVYSDNGLDYVTNFTLSLTETSDPANSSAGSVSGQTVKVTPAIPGVATYSVKDANYYGAIRPVVITVTNTGALETLTINGDTSVNIRNSKSFTVSYGPTTTHTSQRTVTWAINTRPGGDSVSSIDTASGVLTSGYEIGKINIKASRGGISTNKDITVTAPAGAVRFANGVKRKFTETVDRSISGEVNVVTGLAIPSSQVIDGFYVYDPASGVGQTKVDFAGNTGWTNSAGHTSWLFPSYASTTVSGTTMTIPAGKQNLAIPSNITNIAGSNCGANLKGLYLPNSITQINSDSTGIFKGATGLIDIRWSPNLKVFGDNCFEECTSISVPSELISAATYFGYDCFANSSLSGGVMINPAGATIGEYAFYKTPITMFTSTASSAIGRQACYDCDSLVGVNTASTSIGVQAFYGCDYLTSITLGGSGLTIGESAFAQNPRLSAVTFTGVSVINNEAFYNCDSLVSVVFPSSITRIGQSAFASCGALTTVDFLAKGAAFNNMTIGDGAYNTWSGSPIRYVKVTQSCFSYQLFYEYYEGVGVQNITNYFVRAPGVYWEYSLKGDYWTTWAWFVTTYWHRAAIIWGNTINSSLGLTQILYNSDSNDDDGWTSGSGNRVGAGKTGGMKFAFQDENIDCIWCFSLYLHGLNRFSASWYNDYVVTWGYAFTHNGNVGGSWAPTSGTGSWGNWAMSDTVETCVYPGRLDYLLPWSFKSYGDGGYY